MGFKGRHRAVNKQKNAGQDDTRSLSEPLCVCGDRRGADRKQDDSRSTWAECKGAPWNQSDTRCVKQIKRVFQIKHAWYRLHRELERLLTEEPEEIHSTQAADSALADLLRRRSHFLRTDLAAIDSSRQTVVSCLQ